MTCISAQDPQLRRLANAIAERVGQQRFHVWFNNSTRLDLKNDGLEIAVPNDFISEWIGRNFTRPIQEAAHEVLGCSLALRFNVLPQLFAAGAEGENPDAVSAVTMAAASAPATLDAAVAAGAATLRASRAGRLGAVADAPISPRGREASSGRDSSLRTGGVGTVARESAGAVDGHRSAPMRLLNAPVMRSLPSAADRSNADRMGASPLNLRPRLRHDLESFVVGSSNQLAYTTITYVSEFPGAQYNPLFIHGGCGLGKTHLLQGLCKRFIANHPTKRWSYLTGEEFTNEFLASLRGNKLDVFRRKLRDLDLLVIDDVHFLGGKKATQEEFLHTFNAIEAMGKQVVMASDNHPKMIEEFGESLINRFVSGMVVRIDPPNFATRCELLRSLSARSGIVLSEEVTGWVARRVTQNVRELEGAITRIAAHVHLSGVHADVRLAQEALGDLEKAMVAPIKPEAILQSICGYFSLEQKELMSGRRQRTISLARSVAMFLIRKTAKLSFPEIGQRMGKRNHSTVISACRRIERAVARNEPLVWTSAVGERQEEAAELLQRLEEHSRALN